MLEDRHTPAVSLADLLAPDAVAVPLQARTRGSVIEKMTELAMMTGLLWDAEKMADSIRERENLHPTALDNGVALLHPRRPQMSILAEPVLAFGRTFQGVPFGGARGGLTDVFFLICSTDDRGHLRVLARLSRLLNDPQFLPTLRELDDTSSAHAWIVDREAELFGDG